MGIDIVPLAYKHKLDISSPDAFAKDISKRFSANIILKKRDEDYNTIEMFRLHHENAKHDISIIMEVITGKYKRLYEVCIDAKKNTSFDVYPYHVDMYLTESPFRWLGLERCIWEKNTPDCLEILMKYRNYIKKSVILWDAQSVCISQTKDILNHYCPRKSFNISKSNKLIVTRQN